MAKIIGATHIYGLKNEDGILGNMQNVMLCAKKGWLSKTWNLYSVTKTRSPRPWSSGRSIGFNHNNFTVTRKKQASGLSLKEVFKAMAEHEKNPPPFGLFFVPLGGGSDEFDDFCKSNGLEPDGEVPCVGKDIPEDDLRYWRYVKDGIKDLNDIDIKSIIRDLMFSDDSPSKPRGPSSGR